MVHFKPPKNRRLFIIAMVMIVIGFSGLGFGIYQAHSSKADETSNLPNFTPVLPEGTSMDTLEGWQKLSSPNGDVFYAFVDTVNGVTVNVSQQQLPGKFKSDLSNKMLEMARAYNANTKLQADDDVKIYVGTSAKGPQSVLFTKNGVLVLMKSWATIPDADWITYVNSMQ
jgi:hypothetical protein